MTDEVTKQERARQASEALHRVCEAHGVRIMTRAGATVFGSDDDGVGLHLFTFDTLGYYPTEDEVKLTP